MVCECTLMITGALPEAKAATTAVLNSELQLRWIWLFKADARSKLRR